MARNYFNWSNSRPSGQTLLERPNITTVVNGNKRYFSSLDAEIFVGGCFIDEITSITWSIQQQTMPLYGYNSYTFDDVAVGTRLVTGQFSVNYLQSDFLSNLVNSSSFISTDRKLYGADKKVQTDFTDDFRKRLSIPKWDRGFDIVIGFGDHSKNYSTMSTNMYETYEVLDCCVITGSMIQMDYTGAPIQEIYTFIARDIKYKTATEIEQDTTKDTNQQDKFVNKNPLSLSGSISFKDGHADVNIQPNNASIQLQSGSFSFLNTFSDKKLSSTFNATMNGSSLYYQFNKQSSSALSKEINNKSLSKLTARINVKYLNPNKEVGNALLTKLETISLDIVK